MPKRIIPHPQGPGLFNTLAISLGLEILSGRLDNKKEEEFYKHLLSTLAQRYPNFNPPTWETLKEWIYYYNNSIDLQLV